jgi:muramoyltetrapeptide carboxypeptidase
MPALPHFPKRSLSRAVLICYPPAREHFLHRMKFPRPLMPGEKVAIISPAGKIDRRVVEHGAQLLEQHGFTVGIGRHACDAQGVFAGADIDRAADMQQALDDPSVRAVFFSRGGYGSLRTHLRLDWSAEKWSHLFSKILFLAREIGINPVVKFVF